MVKTRKGDYVQWNTPKPKKLKKKVTFTVEEMKTSPEPADPVHTPEFSSYPYDMTDNDMYKRRTPKTRKDLTKIGKGEKLKSIKTFYWSKKDKTTSLRELSKAGFDDKHTGNGLQQLRARNSGRML